MKISFNPSNSNKNILDLIKNNKDIIFDLKGQNIFARGVKFCGTDTWRDIKINNVSIGSNILDLRNGSNTTLTNTNGVVTINSTWRPVVDNLTSDSTTSSLSAKQGKILKSLIDGKSNSGHTHDDRYLKLTGGTMTGNIILNQRAKITKFLASTSNYESIVSWSVDGETKKYGREIGLHNTGGSDSTGSIAIVPYKTDIDPWSGTVGLFIAKNTLKLDGKPIAFKSDIPSSVKNPYSLTLLANGTTLATYDGSVSKIVNLTYDNVGAAAKNHTHNSLEPWASYITGDSHSEALKSLFNENKTSIPRNKFISMYSSAYGNGSYYMGYFLYGYENAPYGGFFVAHYDTAYYVGILNGSFSLHRLAYSTDIPNSLKNPHALTISLNGTSLGPYDGSAAKNINITPGSIGAATSGHNHDNRYLKLTGGTMQLGEGLKFHADGNYFGTDSDARIISLLDGNDKICDGGLIIDERGTLDGKEYVTELLRIRHSEFKWKGSNILHSENTYVSNNKGYINSTEITLVNNADTVDGVHVKWNGYLESTSHLVAWESDGSALRDINPSNVSVGNSDKLDGYHATSGNNKPWGTIPVITAGGYMDIGKQLEFHYDNTTGSDYSTILRCTGNYSNIIDLPSMSGTLALTSQIPNVTNYYWANIKISDTSNSNTAPTFGSAIINTRLSIAPSTLTKTSPTSLQLVINGPYLDSSVTPGLKDWPGIGFHMPGRTWGSLIFDGNITAINSDYNGYVNYYGAGFRKNGSSDSYVLLGGGGHKALSDFMSSTIKYALSDTIGGNALLAYKLYYPSILEDLASIDNFHETRTFKYGLWLGNSKEMGSSFPGTYNGIILSGGWISEKYGFQLAIDDDPNYFIALRQRNNGTWYTWKRIPMGDGTGASGTWGINITGSAGSVAWGNITGKPSSFTPASHNHSFTLGATTITTGETHTVINGPFAIYTESSAGKAFSIYRDSVAEGVKHWIDDSMYHIEYTNDEAVSSIAIRLIDTDLERATNKGADAKDVTVYLDCYRHFYPSSNNTGSIGISSSKWANMYATTFHGSLDGNATTATNSDTLDGYHASSLVKFYLSPMTSGAPADSAKSWFVNTMPSASGAIVYNVPGSEKTIIAGKSSGAHGHMLQLNYDDNYLRILRYHGGSWKSTDWEKISAGYADSAGSVAWSNISGRPSSLKNPYSLNVFGVTYDGSAAKTVTTSTFVSLLSEGTSTVTDGTMFITSWASDSGFSDTSAVNVPYKRKASCLWNYIDSKVSSKYLPLAGGTMNGNARISHGSGNLYIGNSGNDGWIYTQDIASLKGTDKWTIRESGAAHFGALYIASKTDNSFNSSVIECNSTINLNYFSSLNISLCNGGGTVQIGSYTTGDTGNNKLYVNGSEFINGASNVRNHVFADGFRHRSHNSNDSVLLAGGGYSQGVPVRYWAIYYMYIGNSSTDVTYTKRSGNYDFITSKEWDSEGVVLLNISFPSGYNKNNTLIFGSGDHRTSSSWKTPVYVTITTSPQFGWESKIRVMMSDDASLNTGFANIYFMCMG